MVWGLFRFIAKNPVAPRGQWLSSVIPIHKRLKTNKKSKKVRLLRATQQPCNLF